MDRVEQAFRQNMARLYGYAHSLTGDRDAAQDLLQDCAVNALSAAEGPAVDGALRAWLFRILRNAWIDRHRRDRLALMAEPPEPPRDDSEYWTHDDRLINSIAVRQAMDRLPAAYRDIIALVDLGGFPYVEVAMILDVPIGTVMSRLSRARRALLGVIGEGKVRPLHVRRGPR